MIDIRKNDISCSPGGSLDLSKIRGNLIDSSANKPVRVNNPSELITVPRYKYCNLPFISHIFEELVFVWLNRIVHNIRKFDNTIPCRIIM